MNSKKLDPRLPLIQNADLKDGIVLVRVDHKVIKKVKIRDPYRIDATLGTLYNIVGGTVLKVIEEGSPYGLEPVKALMENTVNMARSQATSV